MARKMKHSRNHLTLENPTSDATMSDRVFYGTGQKFLTPIKLPGIDEDHDFFFPGHAKAYMTEKHRDMFRYTNKAPPGELLRMYLNMYPDKKDKKTSLLDLRDRILQIDFAVVEALPSREKFFSPGVMLFIDAKSRTPMGIWESSRTRMFLPNEGRDWEHAKYFFRVCERAVVAGAHVQETHFGWSHAGSTAAWQTLPPDHGLRILLKPFTLNVHSVNNAAYHMLVRDHSVLTHGSGLTTEGVTQTFNLIYAHLDFSRTIPDFLKSTNLERAVNVSDLPYYSQGVRLYDAHKEFVEKFIAIIYPTDEDMLKDDAVDRFWNHVNTYGRHLDPCVCDMNSERFFDDNGQWPGFEKTRTCQGLMDFSKFRVEKNIITRRREWCNHVETFNRIKFLRAQLDHDCADDKECKKVMFALEIMRPNMGLKPLKTRAQLIDFLITFIWEVSAGHSFNGDNIPYFSDPEYSGVRMREFDNDGELPTIVDIGSYVFGTSISSLTTVRCAPLLADWTPLYVHYARHQKHLSIDGRNALLERIESSSYKV